MLLEFAANGKKKIAYAASMGRERTPNEHYMRIKPILKSFTAISVREKCHVDGLIDNCGLSNVKLMPDPVFLLSPDEWKMFSIEPTRKKYVFAYLLGDDLKLRTECLKFAERNGCELCYIPYLNRYTYRWDVRHSSVCVEAPSVQDFVGLIKNAEAVITDSFHGSAFSIIFGKRLISLKRFKKKDQASSNSRIDTLFANNHLNYSDYCTIPLYMNEVRSTSIADKYVKEMQKRGMNYLRNSVLDEMVKE
ncbi:MAG: polysaccharide pyruvyl transferase family protein [Oscillospiraceae bacterium]|nr:polysaccharide pyruvyl transferase family protein [Oscillospiraceae bacterium]